MIAPHPLRPNCACLESGIAYASGERAGSGTGMRRPLDALQVLLVEDNFFVGLDLAYLIGELGGSVLGPARSAKEGATKAGEFFDRLPLSFQDTVVDFLEHALHTIRHAIGG